MHPPRRRPSSKPSLQADPRTARRPVSREVRDGEPVVVAYMPDGQAVVFSARTWDERIAGGRSPNIFGKPASGHVYPCSKAYGPDPDKPRGNRDCAGDVAALMMLRKERSGGEKARTSGWTASTKNGDRFDVRDGNVEWSPAKGRRSNKHAVPELRRGLAMSAAGLLPLLENRLARRQIRVGRRALLTGLAVAAVLGAGQARAADDAVARGLATRATADNPRR
jgi:hypothetical protein